MTRGNLVPLAVVLLGIGAPAARAQFSDVNQKLKKGLTPVRTALVLPPQIAFSKLSMKGSEGMTQEAEKLVETLYSLLSQELALRGVKLLPNPGEPKTDAEKYALADLQARFDNIHTQLGKRTSGVDRGRHSLGDGVSTFAPAKGADALVFMRGRASDVTPGKTAYSALSPLTLLYGGRSDFTADLTIVDAKTGEVLAWAPLHRYGNMTTDQDARLTHTIRNALRDIPLPVKAPK